MDESQKLLKDLSVSVHFFKCKLHGITPQVRMEGNTAVFKYCCPENRKEAEPVFESMVKNFERNAIKRRAENN